MYFEKNGIEISKIEIGLPKNSLIHIWSQLSCITDAIYRHDPSNSEYLDKAIEILSCMESSVDSPAINFLIERFHIILVTNKNGHRYNQHVFIFSTEISMVVIYP